MSSVRNRNGLAPPTRCLAEVARTLVCHAIRAAHLVRVARRCHAVPNTPVTMGDEVLVENAELARRTRHSVAGSG
jgi:hypothetical protein